MARMMDLLPSGAGNSLALVDLIQRRVRESDAPNADTALNDRLVGCARYLGISDEDIKDALLSDQMLVIYEP